MQIGIERNVDSPHAGVLASSMCNVSFTYPSAAPVRRLASTARRSARCRGALQMRSG